VRKLTFAKRLQKYLVRDKSAGFSHRDIELIHVWVFHEVLVYSAVWHMVSKRGRVKVCLDWCTPFVKAGISYLYRT